MVVLRALGRFFARIGRWIRDTAWVQPLLIVGGIFGIIFSIPYITSWVGSWFSSSETDEEIVLNYLESKEVSLDNCEKDEGKSKADKLFNFIELYGESGENRDNADFKKGLSTYGERFFIMFYSNEGSGCEDNYKAFKTFYSKWGKDEFADLATNFDKKPNLYTINTSYVDEDNDDDENYFVKYFYDHHDKFFNEIATFNSSEDVNYYGQRQSESYDTNVEYLSDAEKISSPTVLYFDFTKITTEADEKDASKYRAHYGVQEIMFSIDDTNVGGSSDNYSKARTLRDCMLSKGNFAEVDE